MKVWSGHVDRLTDVVVVGSGAGALTAALALRDLGLDVVVLEKADYIGGTSAVSGGVLWVPGNRFIDEDSLDEALTYAQAFGGAKNHSSVLEAYVRNGATMAAFVEETTPLTFQPLTNFPDYRTDLPGSRKGGRAIEPAVMQSPLTGEAEACLRPDTRPPFTMQEYEDWGSAVRFDWELLERRSAQGVVARGRALISALVSACIRDGVAIATGVEVRELLADSDGRVKGVADVSDGVTREFPAHRAVILACGGFEWNQEMVKEFLPGPIDASCSPPGNTGDGIRMGAGFGARLGNMTQATWGPMAIIPGLEVDGKQRGTLLRFERTAPGSIMVNTEGRRFVNEAANYNDMVKAFHHIDPNTNAYRNLPAYLVFDSRHLRTYGFLTHRYGEKTPDWLIEGQSIGDIAQALSIDEDAFEATVARFNEMATRHHDEDFLRGDSDYDLYWGDKLAEHPCLGPVEEAPFYAIEVVSGTVGTKGGLVTDNRSRVVSWTDETIDGLYAIGNTAAAPIGAGYPGAGSTLGPAMTMGYLAAHDVARAE